MLSIIADAMRIASRTETGYERAKRRFDARQEAERRDREFYRRWLNSSGSRW